jgi:hypothetical protein
MIINNFSVWRVFLALPLLAFTCTVFAQNVGINSPGSAPATSGTIQTSDRKPKTDIKDLKYGVKEVMALQPVSYNWKDKPNTNNKIGLIAQDTGKIIPEVVLGDEAKENIVMNYAELVPVLISAIQEQQSQIERLKTDVAVLQNVKKTRSVSTNY